MAHHPDKNPDDPLAHETFQKIGQAYETLSDPNERATYDQHGPNGPPRGGNYEPDLDDLFSSMFGGSFGMHFDDGPFGAGGGFHSFDPNAGPSRRPRSRPNRGTDTNVSYEISLEESYIGKRVVMGLERDRVCGHCKGSGARKDVKASNCSTCEGRGSVVQDRHLGPGLVGKMKVVCPDCDGEGVRLREKDKCKRCKGKKVVREKKRVEFHIEPGTIDGERIALKGEGDEAPEIPPGDVIFHIHIKSHPLFKLRPTRPTDLNVDIKISLSESLLGMNRTILKHLDGKGRKIISKRGERVIKDGQEVVIRGDGLPIRGKPGSSGDLWVKFEVELPGESWASRQDVIEGSYKVELPGPLPELDPLPEEIVTRYLSAAR